MKTISNIKNNFLRYINIYDPTHFSLIYSLKAMIAIIISVIISYTIFGKLAIVWAALTPIYIFFLNTMISDKDTKIIYLIAFVLLSCIFVFIFDSIARFEGGIYLIIPASIFAFTVGISSAYSKDMQSVLTSVFVNALVSCIYVLSNIQLKILDEIIIILIGGIVAIIVRFVISFGRYGRFTIKTFTSLLFSVSLMLDNIFSQDKFLASKVRIIEQINNLKIYLNTQSAKIKDPHLIKDLKRVLFYLYRIEDICASLSLLHKYFIKNDNKQLYIEVKNEINYNLSELSKIFHKKKPHLKYDVLDSIKNDDKIFYNLFKIIYCKMEFFKKVSNDEINVHVEIPKHNSIKAISGVFSLSNTTFRYSIRYAFIIAISVFIATFFQINNGIWIAIGAISIIRPSIGTITNASKQYLLGSFIGFISGFVLVLLFKGSIFFIPLIFIAIFCVLYFKVFPYQVWVCILSIGLVIMFSLINENFISLIFERFIDIAIGIFLVIIVFLTILVNKNDKSILISIKNILKVFEDMLESLISNNKIAFINKENSFLIEYKNLLNLIEHIPQEYHTIYTKDEIKQLHKVKEYLDSINEKLIELNDYLSTITITNDKEVLYINDFKILKIRFTMLINMIEGSGYFFRADIEGRILSEDKQFEAIVLDIFSFQMQIYTSINPILKRIT